MSLGSGTRLGPYRLLQTDKWEMRECDIGNPMMDGCREEPGSREMKGRRASGRGIKSLHKHRTVDISAS